MTRGRSGSLLLLRVTLSFTAPRRFAPALVGVGIRVAPNPLHRSGQAALPHPALALGDDGKAHVRVGMTDASGWKPASDITRHPLPGQVMDLAASLEDAPPQPANRHAEAAERATVARHP